LNDKNSFEEKLKKEIEAYKRQLNFYKEKIKVDISNTSKKFENAGLNMRSLKANNDNKSTSKTKTKRFLNTLNSSKIKKNTIGDKNISLKKNESTIMKENGLKIEMPITTTDHEKTNAENEEIFNGDISFTDKSQTIQQKQKKNVNFEIAENNVNSSFNQFKLNSKKINSEKKENSLLKQRKNNKLLKKFQVS